MGPRTHCLVFSIVLRLAEVKLIDHLQIFLILYYVGPLRHQGCNEILTNLRYPWDTTVIPCGTMVKVFNRTSRGQDFNSPMGPNLFTISIQCVFINQCFIINLKFLFKDLSPLMEMDKINWQTEL